MNEWRAPIDSTQVKNTSSINNPPIASVMISCDRIRRLINKSFPLIEEFPHPCSTSLHFPDKPSLLFLSGGKNLKTYKDRIEKKGKTKTLLWSRQARTYVEPEAEFELLHKQHITNGTTWIFLLLSTFLSILILFSSLCSRGPGSCTASVTVTTCNISADVGWTLRTVHLGCNSVQLLTSTGNANRVLIWLCAYEKALQERPSSLRLMSSSTFNPRFDASDIFQTLFFYLLQFSHFYK